MRNRKEAGFLYAQPVEYLPVNSLQFVASYQETLEQPLNIVNHIGVIAYPSSDQLVQERGQAIKKFMLDPTNTDNRWGQTLFAEPTSCQIIETAFRPVFENRDISVILAPTSMDASIFEEDFYQKGTDLCIAKDEGGVYTPLCGIDVTLGQRQIVRYKRNRPGFQSFACMPVLVLPLNELKFDKGKKTFTDYLNTHALKAVHRGVQNHFYGLSKDETLEWKHQLYTSMTDALDECRISLQKENYYITSFPYHEELIKLLDEMNGLMETYKRHIDRLH